MSEGEWFLIVYSLVVPALVVAIGATAAWLHGRSMDREDARARVTIIALCTECEALRLRLHRALQRSIASP